IRSVEDGVELVPQRQLFVVVVEALRALLRQARLVRRREVARERELEVLEMTTPLDEEIGDLRLCIIEGAAHPIARCDPVPALPQRGGPAPCRGGRGVVEEDVFVVQPEGRVYPFPGNAK